LKSDCNISDLGQGTCPYYYDDGDGDDDDDDDDDDDV